MQWWEHGDGKGYGSAFLLLISSRAHVAKALASELPADQGNGSSASIASSKLYISIVWKYILYIWYSWLEYFFRPINFVEMDSWTAFLFELEQNLKILCP